MDQDKNADEWDAARIEAIQHILEPWLAEPGLKVRCGKCRRVLGTAEIHISAAAVVLDNLPSLNRDGKPSLAAPPWNWPKGKPWNPRPWSSQQLQIAEHRGKTSGLVDRMVIRCHPRCGAIWSVKMTKLAQWYVAAKVAGESDLVLGI